jgi:hypothetical protein
MVFGLECIEADHGFIVEGENSLLLEQATETSRRQILEREPLKPASFKLQEPDSGRVCTGDTAAVVDENDAHAQALEHPEQIVC